MTHPPHDERINMTNFLAETQRGNIRDLIQARGLNKKAFAAQAGVSYSSINGILAEENPTDPSARTIEKIEQAYGLAPGTLDEKNPNLDSIEEEVVAVSFTSKSMNVNLETGKKKAREILLNLLES